MTTQAKNPQANNTAEITRLSNENTKIDAQLAEIREQHNNAVNKYNKYTKQMDQYAGLQRAFENAQSAQNEASTQCEDSVKLIAGHIDSLKRNESFANYNSIKYANTVDECIEALREIKGDNKQLETEIDRQIDLFEGEKKDYVEKNSALAKANEALATAQKELAEGKDRLGKSVGLKYPTEEEFSAAKQKVEELERKKNELETKKNENEHSIRVLGDPLLNNQSQHSIASDDMFLDSATKLKNDFKTLGIQDQDNTHLIADGTSAPQENLESMLKNNENPDSTDVYYAKEILNGQDLAVVKLDKKKEGELTPEARKKLTEDMGYKKVDSGLVERFKEKNNKIKNQKDAPAAEENKGVEAGGESQNDQETESNQDSMNRAIDTDKDKSEEAQDNTPESTELKGVDYDKRKEELKKEMAEPKKNKDDKGLLEIVPGHSVKYVKVNGNNKIKFPIYEKIMGLPPMTIFKDERNNTTDIFNVNIQTDDDEDLKKAKEYFLYNIEEQLNSSFPILTIHPLDTEYAFGTNGKIASSTQYKNKLKEAHHNVINDVTYKFAVTTNNNITYNHQNNYSPDSFENGALKVFEGFGSFLRQGTNLAQTTAGMQKNSAFKDLGALDMRLGGTVNSALAEIRETANETAKKYPKYANIASALNGALGFSQDVLGGGRIDFPDAWQDSKTEFQQQFSIELRTLNPDPNSDAYFYELLLPLYILLTLSLPTEGNLFAYKVPPLITCSLDESFLEIKLGAITNISWSFEMKEINFKKVPYHCKVDLTIRDLYSVMSQGTYKTNNDEYVDTHNEDIMTKDKYIKNFVKNVNKKKVPNEKYYLTEFAKIPAYMEALNEKMAAEEELNQEKQKDSSVNKPSTTDKKEASKEVKGADGTKTGTEKTDATTSAEIRTDPKTGKKSLVQSVGGFVTGITNGIKNVVAGVNKAIPTVKQLIDTGKTILNTAQNLKVAIKCVGQTANIDGILNGSFAGAVGLAFDNLSNAGEVFSNLSGGIFNGGLKSLGGICSTLSDISRSALTLDLPSCVSEDGKSVSLLDQIKVASSTVGATLGMVRSIGNTIKGAKMIGSITKSSDPLATLGVYLNAANSIIDDVDFTNRLLNGTKGSAIASGQYTAAELASNANLQDKFAKAAATVAENARLVNATMFNTTLFEYMYQQTWFNDYFELSRTPTSENPISYSDIKYKTGKSSTTNGSVVVEGVNEVTGLTQALSTEAMGKIDSMVDTFVTGAEKFGDSCKVIDIQSTLVGLANVGEDLAKTIVITANNTSKSQTAGGTVTIG